MCHGHFIIWKKIIIVPTIKGYRRFPDTWRLNSEAGRLQRNLAVTNNVYTSLPPTNGQPVISLRRSSCRSCSHPQRWPKYLGLITPSIEIINQFSTQSWDPGFPPAPTTLHETLLSFANVFLKIRHFIEFFSVQCTYNCLVSPSLYQEQFKRIQQ